MFAEGGGLGPPCSPRLFRKVTAAVIVFHILLSDSAHSPIIPIHRFAPVIPAFPSFFVSYAAPPAARPVCCDSIATKSPVCCDAIATKNSHHHRPANKVLNLPASHHPLNLIPWIKPSIPVPLPLLIRHSRHLPRQRMPIPAQPAPGESPEHLPQLLPRQPHLGVHLHLLLHRAPDHGLQLHQLLACHNSLSFLFQNSPVCCDVIATIKPS